MWVFKAFLRENQVKFSTPKDSILVINYYWSTLMFHKFPSMLPRIMVFESKFNLI